MSQLRVLEREYGKVKVKVYGGLDEIGGNCVIVEDGDKKIVFDNGIRFSVLRKFYGGRIEPLGLSELRAIGVLPPLGALQEASAIYISHLHLDHAGLLSSIPPDVSVKVPSARVLESTLASWYKRSGSWLAYVPPDYTAKVEELEPKREDENGVTAIPVSHSCFPAHSFLYRGSDATVFYSGDFRLEPLANVRGRLDEGLRGLGIDGVDVALLEGTNFSVEHALMTASMFREYVSLLFKEYGLVSISIDPLDLEALTAILDLSLLMDRSLVVGSERLLWALDEVGRLRPEALDKACISEELEVPAPLPLGGVSLADEVLKDPEGYVLLIEPVGLLQVLRKLKVWGEAPSLAGSAVVLMDPEPRESVKEVEEGALRAWLRSFGAQAFRLRLSGHYLPHQFRYIVEALRPKDLIPLHTEEAELMRRLFKAALKA
jgi:ribonuclease J